MCVCIWSTRRSGPLPVHWNLIWLRGDCVTAAVRIRVVVYHLSVFVSRGRWRRGCELNFYQVSCGRSCALAALKMQWVFDLSLSLSLSLSLTHTHTHTFPAPLSHEPTRPPASSILCMRFYFLGGSRRWKSVIERFVRVYK